MNSNIDFICPICSGPLEKLPTRLFCAASHNFDVAKEGYVNLLTGRVPGKLEGDSKEMIHARRQFLGRRLYARLAEQIADAALEISPLSVADFGCGDGYYLGKIIASSAQKDIRAYGTDISRAAIVVAAKAHPSAYFAVADTNRFIPLRDASIDVAICVFAPRNADEFARVMRPEGRLVVVIPRENHLASLRDKFGLIGIEAGKADKITGQLSGFSLLSTRFVDFDLTLDRASLSELLEMTPNARHLGASNRAEIDNVDQIQTQAHFELMVFSRK